MATRSFDAVVVGSGLGGLTAAALLARHGFRVAVIEKHYLAGGYATTFSRLRGQALFDVSLHGMGGLDEAGLVRRKLEQCGVWERLRFVQPPSVYRQIFPRHDLRIPSGDARAYVELMARLFPGEREGIRRLVDEVLRTYAEYALAQERAFKDFYSNVRAYALLIKYSRLSVTQMLSQFISDEACRCVLSGQWSYQGVPPSRLPGITYCVFWVESVLGGTSYPVGTCQALVQAFVAVIRENGGEVRLSAPVEGVRVEDGRVRAVVLRGGEEFETGLVIASANPHHVVHDLVGARHFPEPYLRRLRGLRPGLSSFLVFLGFDGDVARRHGLEDYEVVLTPSYDIDEQYRRSLAGDVHLSEVTLTIPSNLPAAPGAAPPPWLANLSTLSGFAPWTGLSPAEYRARKAWLAEQVLGRIEPLIPDVRAHVSLQVASTPLTNVRFTGNTAGAIYGFEKDLDQFSRTRQMSRTPVDGLYFASAWAFPGGGYSGAVWSGYFCVFENDLLARRLDVRPPSPQD